MNEILQQRIESAANHYLLHEHKSPLNEILHQCDLKTEMQYHRDIESAYIAGATFALQNQWILVEEALPPIRKKDIENRSWSDWVLIITHKGGTFMDCYVFHRKEWLNNGNDVTHWMPIPKTKEAIKFIETLEK